MAVTSLTATQVLMNAATRLSPNKKKLFLIILSPINLLASAVPFISRFFNDLYAIKKRQDRARVSFTNILRTDFLYESFTGSLFVLAVKVKLFIGARVLAQMCL
jgi:hypothetical protein